MILVITKQINCIQNDLPKLLLHIGPYKTGTTSIQSFYFSLDPNISSYFWPMIPSFNSTSEESMHPIYNFVEYIRRGNASESTSIQRESFLNIKSFLQDSLVNSNNVFISCETLSSLYSPSIHLLQEVLIGFNVTVVIFYREVINRLFSLFQYNLQTEKFRFDNNILSVHKGFVYFIDYLVMKRKKKTERTLQNIESYIDVFGQSNIHIIDYYGMQKLNIDINKVVGCDIMKTLCDYSFIPIYANTRHHDNVKYELMYLFFHYIQTKELLKNESCLVKYNEFHETLDTNLNNNIFTTLIESYSSYVSIDELKRIHLFTKHENTKCMFELLDILILFSESVLKNESYKSKIKYLSRTNMLSLGWLEFSSKTYNLLSKYHENILYFNEEANIQAFDDFTTQSTILDIDSMRNDTFWLNLFDKFLI